MTPQLRIALIAPPWFAVPPRSYGGTERVVSSLAEGLTARGHDVTLFASPGSATSARLVTTLDRLPANELAGDPALELRHARAAYRHAREFDVVHDHGGPLSAEVGSRCGRPVVQTVHTAFTAANAGAYARLSERIALVTLSHSHRRQAPAGVRVTATVHNGIELRDFPPAGPERGDALVFLGRANEGKGVTAAIEVARRAGRRLLLRAHAGDLAEQRYWRERVEPLLHPEVEVVPPLGRVERAELLGRASASLFPLRWPEPFGLAIVESMAAGTPPIALRAGAAPELIDDGRTGFLADSIDQMVAVVERAGDLDPACLRAAVARRFSAERMVRDYERLYLRLLARARA